MKLRSVGVVAVIVINIGCRSSVAASDRASEVAAEGRPAVVSECDVYASHDGRVETVPGTMTFIKPNRMTATNAPLHIGPTGSLQCWTLVGIGLICVVHPPGQELPRHGCSYAPH